MALKILVLSTTNSTLAPMAQGFLEYYSSKKTQVISAGIQPQPIHKMTLKVMDSVGIPIKDSKINYKDVEDMSYDHIITFSEKAKEVALKKNKSSKIHHLKMDNLDEVTGTDKEIKKAFKASRKELQDYCIEFAEDYLQKKIKK